MIWIILLVFLANAGLTAAAVWFFLRRADQRFAAQATRTRALHDSLLGRIAQLETALERETSAARQAEQNLAKVMKCLATGAIREQSDDPGEEPGF
jgi:hypothetical protein